MSNWERFCDHFGLLYRTAASTELGLSGQMQYEIIGNGEHEIVLLETTVGSLELGEALMQRGYFYSVCDAPDVRTVEGNELAKTLLKDWGMAEEDAD